MLLRVLALFAIVGSAILYVRRVAASPVLDVENTTMNDPEDKRPRGIRNNNPTNIEDSGIPWQGRIGNDGRYVVFDTEVHGLRAGFLEIYDSIVRDHDDTIRTLVSQWAPPFENLTGAYQQSVAQQTGIGLDTKLSYRTHAEKILRAIVRQENGYNPYSDAVYIAAYRAAGKELS